MDVFTSENERLVVKNPSIRRTFVRPPSQSEKKNVDLVAHGYNCMDKIGYLKGELGYIDPGLAKCFYFIKISC